MQYKSIFEKSYQHLESGRIVSSLEQLQKMSMEISDYCIIMKGKDINDDALGNMAKELSASVGSYHLFERASPLLGYFFLSKCVSQGFSIVGIMDTLIQAVQSKNSRSITKALSTDKIIKWWRTSDGNVWTRDNSGNKVPYMPGKQSNACTTLTGQKQPSPTLESDTTSPMELNVADMPKRIVSAEFQFYHGDYNSFKSILHKVIDDLHCFIDADYMPDELRIHGHKLLDELYTADPRAALATLHDICAILDID